MNLRRIEVFLTVAEAGSFTAAADRLHIVQSAVSTTIRDLEDELGSPLFFRNKRPLQLTPAGQLLFARAAPALQELETAHREVRDLQAVKRQRLRVAAPPQVTQVALARILAAFMVEHPQLQMQVVLAGALEAETLVLKGEVDIAVMAVRAVHPDLETRYLWQGASTACVPASWALASRRRISWEEFFAYPLATFPPGLPPARDLRAARATRGLPAEHRRGDQQRLPHPGSRAGGRGGCTAAHQDRVGPTLHRLPVARREGHGRAGRDRMLAA
jgi:DNA-binding transcriptional LysR family regulator